MVVLPTPPLRLCTETILVTTGSVVRYGVISVDRHGSVGPYARRGVSPWRYGYPVIWQYGAVSTDQPLPWSTSRFAIEPGAHGGRARLEVLAEAPSRDA